MRMLSMLSGYAVLVRQRHTDREDFRRGEQPAASAETRRSPPQRRSGDGGHDTLR